MTLASWNALGIYQKSLNFLSPPLPPTDLCGSLKLENMHPCCWDLPFRETLEGCANILAWPSSVFVRFVSSGGKVVTGHFRQSLAFWDFWGWDWTLIHCIHRAPWNTGQASQAGSCTCPTWLVIGKQHRWWAHFSLHINVRSQPLQSLRQEVGGQLSFPNQFSASSHAASLGGLVSHSGMWECLTPIVSASEETSPVLITCHKCRSLISSTYLDTFSLPVILFVMPLLRLG